METISVYDRDTDWIHFDQLRQRWDARDELIASHCVCVDPQQGNPLLCPHFEQGEFPTPGGYRVKRFVRYEPEYKSWGQYQNKTKTEFQLIQEFLTSIASIPKNSIWFLYSSVKKMEDNDSSLRWAAQMSEYVPCWRVKTAYGLTGAQCETLVSTLRIVKNSVLECLAWKRIKTPYTIGQQGPLPPITFRPTALFEILSQPKVEPDVDAECFLREVIQQTYQSEQHEKNEIIEHFCADERFYQDYFWPLYFDGLLLKRENVREYCQRKQYRQICEVKGLALEVGNAVSPSVSPTVDAEGIISVSETNPQRPQIKKRVSTTKKRHGVISGAEAATLLGVTERTIRTWENDPRKAPKGYPGRNDEAAFHLFVNAYEQHRRLVEQARAMNKASSGGFNPDRYGAQKDYET